MHLSTRVSHKVEQGVRGNHSKCIWSEGNNTFVPETVTDDIVRAHTCSYREEPRPERVFPVCKHLMSESLYNHIMGKVVMEAGRLTSFILRLSYSHSDMETGLGPPGFLRNLHTVTQYVKQFRIEGYILSMLLFKTCNYYGKVTNNYSHTLPPLSLFLLVYCRDRVYELQINGHNSFPWVNL